MKVDRRQHGRSPVRGCRAKIEPSLVDKLQGRQFPGYFPVINISVGGLMMLGREALKEGSTVRLQIEIEGMLAPARLRGKVIWTSKVKGKGIYRNGVKILKIDKDSVGRIRALTGHSYARPAQSG